MYENQPNKVFNYEFPLDTDSSSQQNAQHHGQALSNRDSNPRVYNVQQTRYDTQPPQYAVFVTDNEPDSEAD